jgi:hypothetical protein
MSSNSQSPQPQNIQQSDNSSIFDNITGIFSNKNIIIIILIVLVVFLLIGVNLLQITGSLVANISDPLVPAIRDLLSMIGFTAGGLINGSADVVAGTAGLGIDIAKGTTHSIGDLLINSTNPGIDYSKQASLTDVIGISRLYNSSSNLPPTTSPAPVQTTVPTVTSISSQKPKAGWCYVGDFAESRGCVKVTEHDKCISGQIFASQTECLRPEKN